MLRSLPLVDQCGVVSMEQGKRNEIHLAMTATTATATAATTTTTTTTAAAAAAAAADLIVNAAFFLMKPTFKIRNTKLMSIIKYKRFL